MYISYVDFTKKKLQMILGQGYETYMFSGQDTLQKFLVIVAVLMIPIMLLGKIFSLIFFIKKYLHKFCGKKLQFKNHYR